MFYDIEHAASIVYLQGRFWMFAQQWHPQWRPMPPYTRFCTANTFCSEPADPEMTRPIVALLFFIAASTACTWMPGVSQQYPPDLCRELLDYAQWHAAAGPDTPALVFHGVVGGFADRMRGLVAALMLAVHTHRALYTIGPIPGLLPATVNTTVPLHVDAPPPFRCTSTDGDCRAVITGLLENRAPPVVAVAWNIGSVDARCRLHTCSGLVFHYLFRYGKRLAAAAELADVLVEAAVLAENGDFDAMLLRASNSRVVFRRVWIKLVPYTDGYDASSVFQYLVDTSAGCDNNKPITPTFLASDSALLKTMLYPGNTGRRLFSCCWNPEHVARASTMDGVAQLVLDIEVAARASRLFVVQGGFYQLPLHWWTYAPSAPVVRLTTATPARVICGQ